MRILTAADVQAAITMPDAIDAMREAFIALSAGRATVPVRGALKSPDGILLTMPSHLDDGWVVKIVGVNPANAARNLPTVHASLLVLDATTGVPQALMDAHALTAVRTGAASGLATDLLARSGAKTLGVIGAGAQARTQIEAVCAVRPIAEIRLYSRSGAQPLADEIRSQYRARIIVAGSAAEALDGADILVAATTSATPVIHAADVAPGAHINGVGSFTPTMQEVAADVVAKARVFVDHRAGAWAEAGDLIIARDLGYIAESHVVGEIGELAAGKILGRTSPDEITFFKSVGNAVQDNVIARRVLAAATARGLGMIAPN